MPSCQQFELSFPLYNTTCPHKKKETNSILVLGKLFWLHEPLEKVSGQKWTPQWRTSDLTLKGNVLFFITFIICLIFPLFTYLLSSSWFVTLIFHYYGYLSAGLACSSKRWWNTLLLKMWSSSISKELVKVQNFRSDPCITGLQVALKQDPWMIKMPSVVQTWLYFPNSLSLVRKIYLPFLLQKMLQLQHIIFAPIFLVQEVKVSISLK
jgi:hypothetical protein